MSYESLFQQKLQLGELCDNLSKYNLTQNELKEKMERSAERSLVILKWKKYGKDHSREIATDSDSRLSEPKGEQNHIKLSVKIANPQQTINLPIFDKKHTI